MANQNLIFQFKIELTEIEPLIWRTIQVPSKYSFWDLHVAIQDAMGWLDYHLHCFRIKRKHQSKITEIGIPDDELDEHPVLPGWKTPLTDFFDQPGQSAVYLYDYGDSWMHQILLQGILLKEKGVRYPVCIAGERACPPEDCGSVPGYYQMIEILSDPEHPDYQEYKHWLKHHAKNYFPYDPSAFDPHKVKFSNPQKRFKMAFS